MHIEIGLNKCAGATVRPVGVRGEMKPGSRAGLLRSWQSIHFSQTYLWWLFLGLSWN
jgi:hypothetical protein